MTEIPALNLGATDPLRDLRDLRDRLTKAASLLDASIDTYWDAAERNRVRGKAQGVRLALSYVDEALR